MNHDTTPTPRTDSAWNSDVDGSELEIVSKQLERELAEKTKEVERLKEELKRGARILATIVDALEQAVPWIKGTLNRTTEESSEHQL